MSMNLKNALSIREAKHRKYFWWKSSLWLILCWHRLKFTLAANIHSNDNRHIRHRCIKAIIALRSGEIYQDPHSLKNELSLDTNATSIPNSIENNYESEARIDFDVQKKRERLVTPRIYKKLVQNSAGRVALATSYLAGDIWKAYVPGPITKTIGKIFERSSSILIRSTDESDSQSHEKINEKRKKKGYISYLSLENLPTDKYHRLSTAFMIRHHLGKFDYPLKRKTESLQEEIHSEAIPSAPSVNKLKGIFERLEARVLPKKLKRKFVEDEDSDFMTDTEDMDDENEQSLYVEIGDSNNDTALSIDSGEFSDELLMPLKSSLGSEVGSSEVSEQTSEDEDEQAIEHLLSKLHNKKRRRHRKTRSYGVD